MFDKAWENDCAKVHGFIDGCIARYFRSTEKDPSDGRKRYVLIEGMAKEIKDPVQLRFQLLNIFFPARETAAIATSNVLFLLARNPQVWAELRKQALALGDQPITYELLKSQSLQLFRYTFYEGLRLHSPSNQSRRIAVCDTVLPRGGGPDGSSPAFVSQGTMVYLNNFPTMRDPDIWGEDVEAFRPTRFEGKLLGWEFTPFLGGPRICPANQQVISQSIYLLVRLVREFESIENRDECLEFVEGIRMLFESRNGCKIALHPAKDS